MVSIKEKHQIEKLLSICPYVSGKMIELTLSIQGFKFCLLDRPSNIVACMFHLREGAIYAICEPITNDDTLSISEGFAQQAQVFAGISEDRAEFEIENLNRQLKGDGPLVWRDEFRLTGWNKIKKGLATKGATRLANDLKRMETDTLCQISDRVRFDKIDSGKAAIENIRERKELKEYLLTELGI